MRAPTLAVPGPWSFFPQILCFWLLAVVGELKPNRAMGINKMHLIPHTQGCMRINNMYPPPCTQTFAHPLPILLGGVPRAHAHTTWCIGHQLPGAPSHALRFGVEGYGLGVVTYLVLTCALCPCLVWDLPVPCAMVQSMFMCTLLRMRGLVLARICQTCIWCTLRGRTWCSQ